MSNRRRWRQDPNHPRNIARLQIAGDAGRHATHAEDPTVKPQKLLSPKEVADEFGCDRRTVERMFHNGQFPNARQLGRIIRIPEADMKAVWDRAGSKPRSS